MRLIVIVLLVAACLNWWRGLRYHERSPSSAGKQLYIYIYTVKAESFVEDSISSTHAVADSEYIALCSDRTLKLELKLKKKNRTNKTDILYRILTIRNLVFYLSLYNACVASGQLLTSRSIQ